MRVFTEQPEHEEAIRQVIVDAFGRSDEARLVEALRVDGDLAVSLVAEQDGTLCAHAALSRMKSPVCALALAPVSVRKVYQGQGIGSALVRRIIEQAREHQFASVFVVGEPKYYARFGFSVEAAAEFPCRYAGPYFMALHLQGDRPGIAPVNYADAFEMLG